LIAAAITVSIPITTASWRNGIANCKALRTRLEVGAGAGKGCAVRVSTQILD